MRPKPVLFIRRLAEGGTTHTSAFLDIEFGHVYGMELPEMDADAAVEEESVSIPELHNMEFEVERCGAPGDYRLVPSELAAVQEHLLTC